MIQIFLAHASEDKDAVIDLYNRLKAKGFKPWLDKVDLLPGQSWRAEIPKAIRESDVFIACLSKESVAKAGYIQREFRMALQKMGDIPPGKIYLIPVRLDDCQVPELRQEEYGINLADYQWVDLFQDGEFERLVKSIELHFPDVLGKSTSDSKSSKTASVSVTNPDLSDSTQLSETTNYEELLLRLKEIESQVKEQQAPKYDLRDAQFAGGFSETVLGNQIGGKIRNEPSKTSTPESSRPLIEIKTIDLRNGVTLDLVHIPEGTFLMGSPEVERDVIERPQHKVTVPEFWMGKYPVTQEQYQAVIGNNPSYFKGYNCPVEKVSWHKAVAFCDQISQQTGEYFRLPSEAEWEYACRSRTKTHFYFGDNLTEAQANFNRNKGKTTSVGKYPANAFGLYDMHGNVWEWCQDHWHGNYKGAPTDGSAWIENWAPFNRRIIRGGSWRVKRGECRSASRVNSLKSPCSSDCENFIGFRVVSAPQALFRNP
ncbi:SUMF1/EgtB/PvdO family nonheme iron enzyme [Leptothoe sp. EHU-05/26/07-4]